jgi:hypothetical protein
LAVEIAGFITPHRHTDICDSDLDLVRNPKDNDNEVNKI